MSDFGLFQQRKAEKNEAYQDYCRASIKLELAQIKERLAEIKSQAEPLNALIEEPLSERERLYHAAFYVVIGRFPSNPKTADEVEE